MRFASSLMGLMAILLHSVQRLICGLKVHLPHILRNTARLPCRTAADRDPNAISDLLWANAYLLRHATYMKSLINFNNLYSPAPSMSLLSSMRSDSLYAHGLFLRLCLACRCRVRAPLHSNPRPLPRSKCHVYAHDIQSICIHLCIVPKYH